MAETKQGDWTWGSMGSTAWGPFRHYVRPPVDIHATESEVVMLVDLPGVQKSDLGLVVEGDELVLDARVAGREEGESRLPWGYHRRFRMSSSIDRERVDARLENGVLRLTLGKVGGGARKVDVS